MYISLSTIIVAILLYLVISWDMLMRDIRKTLKQSRKPTSHDVKASDEENFNNPRMPLVLSNGKRHWNRVGAELLLSEEQWAIKQARLEAEADYLSRTHINPRQNPDSLPHDPYFRALAIQERLR